VFGGRVEDMRYLVLFIIINLFSGNLFAKTLLGTDGKVSFGTETLEKVEIWELSDEIICDKAPHVDAYPELKPFSDEAKNRGLDCKIFNQKNNSNQFVKSDKINPCPKNYFSVGSNDYCYLIPENGYASGTSFKCKSGFKREVLKCIPVNAITSGNSWKCLSGYEQSGNTCKKKITIPPNAYASGDSWKCKSGYEQSGNTCKKKPEPKKEIISDEVLQAASGTGFIVSEKGHIITNHHVIEGCTEVKVHKDGDVYKGKVIANDILNDLALIKSNYKPNVIFPLRDKNPSLLEDIYVAGFPFGNAISSAVKVTKGVVSSESGLGNNYSNIQIDAALQQGNSGGPILDEKGNVVGVAVAKLDLQYAMKKFGSIPENINFGIKSSVVENLIQAHNVNNPSPNTKEMSKSDLGYNIKQATLYLSCWMTLAQIKKFSTKKVIFRDLVN
jgi:hypothetical protein